MLTTVESVITSLLGCHHPNMSRVFTIRKRTYQVCCDCGKEFAYSWERMERLPGQHTIDRGALEYAHHATIYAAARAGSVTTAMS